MISYEIYENKVISFLILNPRSIKGFRETRLQIPRSIKEEKVRTICDAVVSLCEKQLFESHKGRTRALNHIFNFASEYTLDLPSPGSIEWESFCYSNFIYHFSNPSYQVEHDTKVADWHQVNWIYRRLQFEKIIPASIKLPSTTVKGDKYGDTGISVLGSAPNSLPTPTDFSEMWPKNYLIDKSLSLSTDEFLSSLEADLQSASDSVVVGCLDYWKKMRKANEIGKEHIDRIPTSTIEETLASNIFFKDGKHLADPSQPMGMHWFLATVNYYFCETDQLQVISYRALKNIPFFKQLLTNDKIISGIKSKIRSIGGEFKVENNRTYETLSRLLGLLSSRDCAAACCILIKENPKFPPMSLQHAELLTTHGKPYIFVNADGNRRLFGISKPRAKSRKVSILPDISIQVFEDIIDATSKIRKKLKAHGDVNHRQLFLTASYKSIGPPPSIDKYMNSENVNSLYNEISEHMSKTKINKSTFCLSRIRGTQGMLSFLKNATLKSVSETLGNTISVVRSSYIPNWLLEKWSIRLLRIFQTKMIIIATRGKPWHLAASDFSTHQALVSFITRIATTMKNHDHLSVDIRSEAAKLDKESHEKIYSPLVRNNLILNLTPESLGAIFAFADCYTSNELPHTVITDKLTGLSSESIVLLAKLIDSAYSIRIENSTQAAIQENLKGPSLSYFKKTYIEAKSLKEEYKSKIKLYILKTTKE